MIPEPTYPPGGDLEVLKRLQRRAWLERERRFFELQEAFLRDVKVKAGGLTPAVDPLRLRRDEVQGALF